LRGRDIKRYGYKFADLYLLFIPWHFPLQNDTTIQGASEKAEQTFENQYPAVYNHLLKYKKYLSARNKIAPAAGGLLISGLTSGATFGIYTLQGQLVYQAKASSPEEHIYLQEKGIYMLRHKEKAYKFSR
jgi:hypothetical protein